MINKELYLSPDFIHFLAMFIMEMFPDELWTFKLLARERTQPLIFTKLLCICLDKLLNFTDKRVKGMCIFSLKQL